MSTRIITQEEQGILLKNPHIKKCSEKSIAFTAEFKKYAIQAYREGMGPQDIFRNAGIPLALLGRAQPKECLRRWLKKDSAILRQDGRGKHGKSGRKRKEHTDISKMTDKEKIKYLELYCAYKEAENDFLAKARGIKRVPFVYRPGDDTN